MRVLRQRVVFTLGVLLATCTLSATAGANNADVVSARARCTSLRTCTFSVTIRHADVGRGHFVNRFEVVAPSGTILGKRLIRNPHVHQQPFTLELTGVAIPPGIKQVTVRAHDSTHRYRGRTATVRLSFPAAPGQPTTPSEPWADTLEEAPAP